MIVWLTVAVGLEASDLAEASEKFISFLKGEASPDIAFHVTSGYHDEDFPTLDAFMETIEADPYSLPFEGGPILLRGCRVVQERKDG